MTEKNYTPKQKARRIKTSFVVLTIIFLLILIGFGWILIDVRDLSEKTANLSKSTAALSIANRRRINEIQASRVESCRRTYRSFPEVFKPFLPKKTRTTEQQRILNKLNETIENLKKGCVKQTKPKKSKSNENN